MIDVDYPCIRGILGSVAVAILALSAIDSPTRAATAGVKPVQCTPSSEFGLQDVWDRYVNGLRTGDIALLSTIFSNEGVFHIISASGDGGTAIRTQRFVDALPQWVRSPDAEAQGTLTEASVTRTMATMRGSLRFGTAQFEDIMTLCCISGHWQIVGKLTHSEPS
jgi:hypothetical protein